MAVFLLLFGKLIPLYLLIALGVISGRWLGVQRETVARLLIYIIVPVVIFHGAATVPLEVTILSLPLLIFCLCCTICLILYGISGFFWRDATRNLLAYASGNSNNGYFGLPVILALFSERAFSIAIVAGVGFLLYETTIGLLVLMRGSMSLGQSVRRLVRFPLLYAFVLGLLWNALGFGLPSAATDFALAFRGAYTVLGMMLVGLGLSRIGHLFADLRFVGLTFLAKFLLWPLCMLAILWIDRTVIHAYSPAVHHVLIVFSIIPLAANTVAYATEFRIHPEKAASAVFLSTLFALFYIPFIVAVFL